MRKVQSKVLLLLTVLMVLVYSCSMVFAADSVTAGDESYGSITDYMRGYNYTTEGQMQKASTFASPITNVVGMLTGFIVMITVALVGLVTALDLLYIAVPFTRSFLNPMQSQGGVPMGGMGMGTPMGGGASAEQGLHRKWVSDEAVACVNMSGGSAQPQMAMGAQGGMGMPMGGAPQPAQNTKSVIATYLQKRVVFLVIFAICLTLLLSSVFTDCGLNLAELLYKILSKVNGGIANAQI